MSTKVRSDELWDQYVESATGRKADEWQEIYEAMRGRATENDSFNLMRAHAFFMNETFNANNVDDFMIKNGLSIEDRLRLLGRAKEMFAMIQIRRKGVLDAASNETDPQNILRDLLSKNFVTFGAEVDAAIKRFQAELALPAAREQKDDWDAPTKAKVSRYQAYLFLRRLFQVAGVKAAYGRQGNVMGKLIGLSGQKIAEEFSRARETTEKQQEADAEVVLGMARELGLPKLIDLLESDFGEIS